MSKESLLIQELANTFPSWSRIRSDIDSNGQRLLNPVAKELEDIEKALIKIDKNVHPSTFNLDEIDQLYKIDLPANFNLQETETNTNIGKYTEPTITGNLDASVIFSLEDIALGNTSSNVILDVIQDGDIKTFWEDSLSNGLEKINTLSIPAGLPATKTMTELDSLSPIEHPLKSIRGGGKFYFELIAKHPYIEKEVGLVTRSRIIIRGKTRKGMLENEMIVFPWQGVIETKKEWERIDSITPFDVEDIDSSTVATLKIQGDNSLQEEYLSHTNLKWSQNRKKIDEFWGVITSSALMERVEFLTDNWRLILKGDTEKISKDRWQLEDKDGTDLTSVKDIELIPFKEQAWVLDGSNLYLYNLDKKLNERIDYIHKNVTKNSNSDVILDIEDLIVGEEAVFSLIRKKLLKKIEDYHIWYMAPGSEVKTDLSGTASTHIMNSAEDRILFQGKLVIPSKGEYIFGADVLLEDGTTETVARLLTVKSKKPLKSFSLSSLGISNPVGLFFDSDQKLWIKTTTEYHEVKAYRNMALIDYARKNIYLLEKYNSLAVNYP